MRLLQLERRRCPVSSITTVGSPEEECFQAALECWREIVRRLFFALYDRVASTLWPNINWWATHRDSLALCKVWWFLVSAVLVLSCGHTHRIIDVTERLTHSTVIGRACERSGRNFRSPLRSHALVRRREWKLRDMATVLACLPVSSYLNHEICSADHKVVK